MRRPANPGRRSPWRGVRVQMPPHIPSMISLEEKNYLYWLTRDMWNGVGDIVEVGPWLGGSTWCLAAGMEANSRRTDGVSLHVIDNFRWRPFMSERAPLKLAPNESFRPYFEQNLAPKMSLLRIHEQSLPDDDSATLAVSGGVRADTADLPLYSGRELSRGVAILFVDGAKSWSGLVHLLREIGPRFLRGETLLVLQDFQNWLAYWVPMGVSMLLRQCPGCLEVVHTLSVNTVTLRVTGVWRPEVLDSFPSRIDDIPTGDGMALLESAAKLVEQHDQAAAIARLAKVSFLGTKGAWGPAEEQLRLLERRWPWNSAAIAQVLAARAWVASEVGALAPPSARVRMIDLGLRTRRRAWRLAGRGPRAILRRLRPAQIIEAETS
jgi:hypothetical protein